MNIDKDEEEFYDSHSSSHCSLTQPLLSEDEDCTVNNYEYEIQQSHSLSVPSFLERNRKLAKFCILITVVLERASYYGLTGNLAFYLSVYLRYSNNQNVQLTLTFSSLSWLTCFIGGLLGDGLIGRYKTIVTGLVFYIMGYVCLLLLTNYSHNLSESISLAWLLITFIIISLGEGCFKSNISSFGGDQMQCLNDNEMRNFFNYFYWSMNIGSLTGYCLLTWIQQQYNFLYGYLVPTCLLFLALISFNIPRTRHYRVLTPKENPITKIFKIMFNAKKNNSNQTSYENYNPIHHWLDRSKVKYGGRFSDADVEDTKQLFAVIPVFGFMIIYCLVYYQVSSTFLLQGMHMKLIHFVSEQSSYNMPPAWFMVFSILCVLICVPFIDRFFYPCLDRISTKPSLFIRITIGMVLASFAMVSAGTVEYYRLGVKNITINEFKYINITARDMSILYQLPQYITIGLSEIFVLIAGLEFAYCQAPKSMQSFATCLFFIANGLGAFLGVILISISRKFVLKKKDPENGLVPKMEGNLDYFYYFLAGLNILNTVCFVVYFAQRTKKKAKKCGAENIDTFIKNSLHASLGKKSPT